MTANCLRRTSILDFIKSDVITLITVHFKNPFYVLETSLYCVFYSANYLLNDPCTPLEYQRLITLPNTSTNTGATTTDDVQTNLFMLHSMSNLENTDNMFFLMGWPLTPSRHITQYWHGIYDEDVNLSLLLRHGGTRREINTHLTTCHWLDF